MQIVTKELLEVGVPKGSKINESQCILLDCSDDKNWEDEVLGKQISDARAELFILLGGIKTKTAREQIIANYKALQKFRSQDNMIEEKKSEKTEKIIIYCDGGCVPNPGEAGSGMAVYKDDTLSELWYGLYEEQGTNNTAELKALYQALLLAQKESQNGNEVEIKCDSSYAINCIKVWAISWEKNGWKKKGGAIKNLALIQQAYHLYNEIKQNIKLSHIKAHSGFEGNELADRMTMYTIQTKTKPFVQYEKDIDISALLKMRAG
ncbi:Ribonuclease HI-related protein 2 [hydrothermal vent metagenome]|uniref:ribonuclease H n=1 Tax=hydrothermal vent metagenome TaxID=652676 RepID=A0A1W1D201_9ZZZZ